MDTPEMKRLEKIFDEVNGQDLTPNIQRMNAGVTTSKQHIDQNAGEVNQQATTILDGVNSVEAASKVKRGELTKAADYQYQRALEGITLLNKEFAEMQEFFFGEVDVITKKEQIFEKQIVDPDLAVVTKSWRGRLMDLEKTILTDKGEEMSNLHSGSEMFKDLIKDQTDIQAIIKEYWNEDDDAYDDNMETSKEVAKELRAQAKILKKQRRETVRGIKGVSKAAKKMKTKAEKTSERMQVKAQKTLKEVYNGVKKTLQIESDTWKETAKDVKQDSKDAQLELKDRGKDIIGNFRESFKDMKDENFEAEQEMESEFKDARKAARYVYSKSELERIVL